MIANWKYKCVLVPENPSFTLADVAAGDNPSRLVRRQNDSGDAGRQN
jgi:hypothetical protein